MRGKLLLLIGFGAGYVLGARAGRARYEQIKRAAKKVWNSPTVQDQVKNVEDFARDKAPDVVEFIADNAKKLVSRKEPETKSSSSRSTSTRSTTTRSSGTRSSGTRSSNAKSSGTRSSTAKSGSRSSTTKSSGSSGSSGSTGNK